MKKRIGSILTVLALCLTMLPAMAWAEEPEVSTWNGEAIEAFVTADGGANSADNPYIIDSAAKLAYLAQQVNEGKATYEGEYFRVTANIDLNGKSWTPIGAYKKDNDSNVLMTGTAQVKTAITANTFKGTFDGNHKTISNLKVSMESDFAGLFGNVADMTNNKDGDYKGTLGVIKNVNLVNADVKGQQYVGALAGGTSGNIVNCTVTGTIKVEGNFFVGGLVGCTRYCNVEDSTVGSESTVGTITGTYVKDDYEGDSIGGLIGCNNSGQAVGLNQNVTVKNCTVQNVTVSGTRKVAGLIGQCYVGKIIDNCTVDTVTVVCTANADYAAKKSTSQCYGGMVGFFAGYESKTTISGTIRNLTIKVENDGTAKSNLHVGLISAGKSSGAIPTNKEIGTVNVTLAGKNILPTGTGTYTVVSGNSDNDTNSNVAAISGTGYATLSSDTDTDTVTYYGLADAIAAAKAGDTVKLEADAAVSSTITIGKSLTIDLNGHTITNTITDRGYAFDLASEDITLTVTGTTADSKMVIAADAISKGFFRMSKKSTLTLNGGSYSGNTAEKTDSDTVASAFIYINADGSTLNLTGVAATTNKRVLYTGDLNNLNVTVTNGEYTSADNAQYATLLINSSNKSKTGTVTFENVKVTTEGGAGVEIDGCDATLTGCTFNINGLYTNNTWLSSAVAVSAGSSVTIESGTYTSKGNALAIWSGGGTLTVKGGTFSGEKNVLWFAGDSTKRDVTFNFEKGSFTGGICKGSGTTTHTITAAITGGTFNTQPSSDYIPAGYAATQDESKSTYTVSKSVKDEVAQVYTSAGALKGIYATLSEAVSAADTGSTVKLVKDAPVASTITIDNKTLTIDLNDKTINSTVPGNANNTGTGYTFFSTNSHLTFQNGTLTSSNAGILDSESSTDSSLTLTNVNVTADSGFAVKSCGTLSITGGTITSNNPGNTYSAIVVKKTKGNATIKDCTIKNDVGYGITAAEGANVTLEGTTNITTVGPALGGNNLVYTENFVVKDNVQLTSTGSAAIFFPCEGTLEISGSPTITGKTGIHTLMGTLKISGTPTIKGTDTVGTFTYSGDPTSKTGPAYNGAAILLVKNRYYVCESSNALSLNITGGTFTRGNTTVDTIHVMDGLNTEDAKIAGGPVTNATTKEPAYSTGNQQPFSVAISGGTFSTDPTAYLKDSTYGVQTNSDDSTYTVLTKPAAPAAPTKSSSTYNSVTLTATAGYEYKQGNGAWQTSNVFSGLSSSTTYTFYQRVAAVTGTSVASDASEGVSIATDTYSGGGGGGSSSSTTTTTTPSTTTTGSDGSTTVSSTTTTTNKTTGAVTETTTSTTTGADGAKTESKVETTTAKDGTKTETATSKTTAADGATTETKSETTTAKDGTKTETTTSTTTAADGATTETKSETVTATDGTKTETTTETTVAADGATTESKSEVVTAADGSKTETVTETTVAADGATTESKSEVVTAADGAKTETVTETTVAADGATKETSKEVVTTAEGVTTSTETVKATTAEGTSAEKVTTVDETGASATTVAAAIPTEVAQTAAQSGEAVTIPVEVSASKDTQTAPTITVDLPAEAGEVKVEIPVTDVTPGTVAVIVHEDGTEEIVKASALTEDGMTVALTGGATIKIVDNSKTFDDMADDHWANNAVSFVSAREIFHGTGNNSFSSEGTMTRGMIAQVLYNLDGAPEVNGNNGLTDVSGDAWYSTAANWAVEAGISSGNGAGGFDPEADVTREQLAIMLWRYAGQPEATQTELPFDDADQTSSYAQAALLWANEVGIMNGRGDGTLDPQGISTRAEVAQMLMNFIQK